MARDIEEFLRRAAERRKQQMQQGKQPQRQPPSERLREVISEVEIVETSPPPMHQQGVAEHVRSHLDTSDIADHARNLGERIQNVDDVVAERLGGTFDRDVSRLDDRTTVTDDGLEHTTRDDSSQIARELIEMLQSPRTIRQAILVSEILKRPDFDD